MSLNRPERSLGRGLVIAAAAVLVLVGMHLASSLIVLIVFSLLVTLLLAPLQQRLIARGIASTVALLICLATSSSCLVCSSSRAHDAFARMNQYVQRTRRGVRHLRGAS